MDSANTAFACLLAQIGQHLELRTRDGSETAAGERRGSGRGSGRAARLATRTSSQLIFRKHELRPQNGRIMEGERKGSGRDVKMARHRW